MVQVEQRTFPHRKRYLSWNTVYLSPSKYERKQNADYIFELEEEISRFSSKGSIILQGDFDARTGNLEEYKLFDCDEYVEAPEEIVREEDRTKRYTQDETTIDSRGRSLIDFCTENNLRIQNGRVIGDSTGKKTCFQYNGSSLVDYVISDIDNFRNVQFLSINPLQPDISDHCRISYGLKINAAGINNSSNTCKTKIHKTVVINEEAKKNIPIILQSKEYKDKLEKILIPTESVKDKSAVNNLIKRFSRLLIEVCEKAGMKYKCKNNRKRQNNWS